MTAGKIPGSCAQPIPCREDEQARLRGPAAEPGRRYFAGMVLPG